MGLNIFTRDEKAANDCKLGCPPYSGNFPDHGDVAQCPHGRWFVAYVLAARYGGKTARWRRATPNQLRKIKKEQRREAHEARSSKDN